MRKFQSKLTEPQAIKIEEWESNERELWSNKLEKRDPTDDVVKLLDQQQEQP